jgi:hypothetical protein
MGLEDSRELLVPVVRFYAPDSGNGAGERRKKLFFMEMGILKECDRDWITPS